MLLAPVAFAGLLQEQGFGFIAPNYVFRSGPQGTATGGNTATVGHSQSANDAVGTAANQAETGILTQSAAAAGVGGWSEVAQTVIAEAVQVQGAASPQTQAQEIATVLTQDARKDHGSGTATGGQGFVGEQNQNIAQGAGMSAETQVVAAAQHGTVAGDTCSVAKSEQGVTVTATQAQTNTNCCGSGCGSNNCGGGSYYYPANW
jgi:hypothetical protein